MGLVERICTRHANKGKLTCAWFEIEDLFGQHLKMGCHKISSFVGLCLLLCVWNVQRHSYFSGQNKANDLEVSIVSNWIEYIIKNSNPSTRFYKDQNDVGNSAKKQKMMLEIFSGTPRSMILSMLHSTNPLVALAYETNTPL